MRTRHTIFLFVASLSLFSTAALAQDNIPDLIANLGAGRAKAARIAAANALGNSQDKLALRAVKALTAGCQDSDAEIRNASVVALGMLVHRHKQDCPLVIVEAMFDPDKTVRTNAAGLMWLVGNLPPEGIALLYKNADHADPVIRADVMMPLARADGDNAKAIRVLENATRDTDAGVRINAVAGLWQSTNDVSRLVPLWLEMLEAAPAGNLTDRQNVLRQLGAIVAADQLRNVGLANPKEVAAALVKALTDRSPRIRRAAARTLGAIAKESAAGKRALRKADVKTALLPLLEDPDESVQAAAFGALQSLKKKNSKSPSSESPATKQRHPKDPVRS